MENYLIEQMKFLTEVPVNDTKFQNRQFQYFKLFEKLTELYKVFLLTKGVEKTLSQGGTGMIQNTVELLLKKYKFQFEILKIEFQTEVEILKGC